MIISEIETSAGIKSLIDESPRPCLSNDTRQNIISYSFSGSIFAIFTVMRSAPPTPAWVKKSTFSGIFLIYQPCYVWKSDNPKKWIIFSQAYVSYSCLITHNTDNQTVVSSGRRKGKYGTRRISSHGFREYLVLLFRREVHSVSDIPLFR